MRRKTHMLRASRPAFSLLEITLVLVIIGLLMGVAAVNLLGSGDRARVRITGQSMQTIQNAIKAYMLENNGTPPISLQALVDAEYLEAENDGTPPRDAWDQVIFYSAQPDPNHPGMTFTLISKGPDKQPSTEDDINLWEIEN
ncbi:MAG: type II secretion system protein GspG [Phycisphaerales bacterium]